MGRRGRQRPLVAGCAPHRVYGDQGGRRTSLGPTPLPSDGVLRTRVSMRLETNQGGQQEAEGVDPGGDNWSWCS